MNRVEKKLKRKLLSRIISVCRKLKERIRAAMAYFMEDICLWRHQDVCKLLLHRKIRKCARMIKLVRGGMRGNF